MQKRNKVVVVGAGLAGCEAVWQLSRFGFEVLLYEMKPKKFTPAHTNPNFCELVCSNSLRAASLENAVGLLKEEMRRLGSIVMECADKSAVAAGGALAVDRKCFSKMMTEKIRSLPNVKVIEEELCDIPTNIPVIIATGPLTSEVLAEKIRDFFGGEEYLSFYDAAAPIVTSESIDFSRAFYASRYGKGTDDYINCPMTKEEYLHFYNELVKAEEAEVHGFEKGNVFEGCMPVEVMAKRGEQTLLFGPLKPVGLIDPATNETPFAVVQLRIDNKDKTLYNMVGFQTHLKFGEQKRVFSLIPALKNAEFVRYGVMHRNTYLASPKVLNRYYGAKTSPDVAFAGQMTGVEGYVESASSGLLASLELAMRLLGQPPLDFPQETAIGALALYCSQNCSSDFQPMNINFGIVAKPEGRYKKKAEKNMAISQHSLEICDNISKTIDSIILGRES